MILVIHSLVDKPVRDFCGIMKYNVLIPIVLITQFKKKIDLKITIISVPFYLLRASLKIN
jgi:hypothetical protein